MTRTLGIAADHGGYELKEEMKQWLSDRGHTVRDYGAAAYDAKDDYPDLVAPLARAVAAGQVER
ncbi:MAG: RpiB/LacA/LacB family sugar-phosphate isomerase, partial [Catalinimonas sp.]